MKISRAVLAYHSDADEHHRYRSWEHCYRYFQQRMGADLVADREHAALQLAFYLASWGMYRGSSFLLQHAYSVHRPVINVLAEPRFAPLRQPSFDTHAEDQTVVPLLMELVGAVRTAYMPFAKRVGSGDPSDTLVTKVILGTLGCLPACDRYFIDGCKAEGFAYSALNWNFIGRILEFSRSNATEIQHLQSFLEESCGLRYPMMKLLDMYFWQLGYERDPNSRSQRATKST